MTSTKKLRLDEIIRVSQRNGREGNSFRSPGQQRELTASWADANGAVIVASHEGIDRSGKTMRRDDINAALARIRAGQTDGIIVAWLDRFSRAPVREALAVYDDIKAADGKVVAVDMAGLNPDDPTGEMALTIQLAVGRMQWRKIAERYAMSRRDAIADGKAMGAPFGYRFTDPTPTDNGRAGIKDSHLVVCEAERSVVRELFERKAAGDHSWLELARWMDGVAPKLNGQQWARSTIEGMIRSRTYLGEARHGQYVNATAHERIVSDSLWRRAQNKPGHRTPRGNYLLSGLVRCAGCGRNMRASSGGKTRKPAVYGCITPGCPTRYTTVTVAGLDAEVVEQLFARLDEFHVRAVSDDELAAAEDEVQERTGEVERLAVVVPKSTVGIKAHQAHLDDAERVLADAEDRRDHLLASLAQGGPDVRQLREDWPSLSMAERREIVRAGVDAVLVRRATLRTWPHSPISERLHVVFHGEAPEGLVKLRGPITSWAWDDDPRSLVASA